MNVHNPIYEYLYMVANECAPGVAFDEYGEPFRCESQVAWDVARSLDAGRLEFPFTKEEYYSNTEVLDVLDAYEIDIEKFWYAVLFIYHFTKSKIADGIKLAPSPISQINSLLDYLRNGEEVKITVTAENKKRNLVIKEPETFSAVADVIEAAKSSLQEIEILHARSWDDSDKSSVGKTASTQIAYATARYQALFDKLISNGKRAKHTKSKTENVRGERYIDMGMTQGPSFSRLLLISRLMYFSYFTENEEYLLSEEPLNGVLKDYKNVEINTKSREHWS